MTLQTFSTEILLVGLRFRNKLSVRLNINHVDTRFTVVEAYYPDKKLLTHEMRNIIGSVATKNCSIALPSDLYVWQYEGK